MFDFLGAHVTVLPVYTLLVVTIGMLILAAADICRHEVEDWATAILFLVACAGLLWEGVSPHQWLAGALSGAIAFLVYLALGMQGFIGGGDVKLAAVPALVLGACVPFLGVWWVAASIGLQQVFFIITTRLARPRGFSRGQAAQALVLPHVPAMATVMLIAPSMFLFRL